MCTLFFYCRPLFHAIPFIAIMVEWHHIFISMQVIFLQCIRGYNSLGDPTRQFEGKKLYKLIRSKGWQNASWQRTQNKSQKKILFNVADQIWCENDQNETKLHDEYDHEYIRNSLSSYPVRLAINLPWPALKNKQRMCFELFEVFLTSSADQCFV